MKLRGGNPIGTRWKKAIAAIACLTVISASYAGWSIHRATDTTLVKPIVLPGDLALQTGDIIVAGGVSLQSRIVLAMSDNNRYSHVGIIQVTPQGLFVIHAAPNGAGDGGVGNQVARIPLSLFLAERGYVAVQVMRLKAFTEDAKQLTKVDGEWIVSMEDMDKGNGGGINMGGGGPEDADFPADFEVPAEEIPAE